MGTHFSITDLAREFAVTNRAIRFYEDEGLISPDRDGQRRVYNQRDRIRLMLILRGRRLGFSLKEIREIIDLYDADPNEIASTTNTALPFPDGRRFFPFRPNGRGRLELCHFRRGYPAYS
jgi:DNA-binding transcriptional MerR regulator